jgi:PadR family transcriptional regulator PadR
MHIAKDRSEVLQGTLDSMVLKTLDALGPFHGDGITRRLEQLSASGNNRKAKYYSIGKSGRGQMTRETANWERISSLTGRVLRLESQG